MEIFKKLAEKLEISENDLLKKFNLNEESKTVDILNALGIYAIFENKQNLEDYLSSKISNKQKEINELLAKINDLHLSNEELKNNLNNYEITNRNNEKTLTNLLAAEWEKLGIKRDFSKSGLNINEVDFKNLPQYLLNFAEKEGYSIQQNLNNENSERFNKNNELINYNGIIKK